MTQTEATPRPTASRRLYRGLVFAVIVGAAGAALGAAPALFIQSIYIGESQRCIQAQETDIAITGEIETNCAEAFADPPLWLPPSIVAGGALMGIIGGFTYGFVAPKTVPKDRNRWGASDRWLPF